MANATTGDFPLPQTGYLVFDSLGLKAALKERLSESGVFTDQVYEGSNLAQIIDLMAYNYNTLIYYANRTSTETTFTDTVLYENANRMVKMIGYNPIGYQTSILTFTASALSDMPTGLYTLPKYSYVNLGSISYSFNDNITFYKDVDGQNELLVDFSDSKLFLQGRFIEYPTYSAIGEEGEQITMLPGDNVIVDHFNVDVYVKDSTDTWKQWERTNTLYQASANDKKFEIRLNENNHYEIKFGNNINGRQLGSGDSVAIYYLKSNGKAGEVGANALLAGKLIKYNTTQFNAIFDDTLVEEVTVVPDNQLINMKFDNESSSTYSETPEDTESIKENAPSVFRSQYRLVTEGDFLSYVKTNFSNLVHDVKVGNNWYYLSKYLKYFHDLGITDPNNVSRVLYNQVNFADSCNFNNIYMFIVSKSASTAVNQMTLLNPSLKSLIISSMSDIKMATSEPIILDPVFLSLDVGLSENGEVPTIEDVANTELVIVQENTSKRDPSSIQGDVDALFTTYFERAKCSLGQIIDVDYLNNSILSIDGVDSYYTRRKDDPSIKFDGLNLIMWNPVYPSDIQFLTQNVILQSFQFPFLNDRNGFVNKVVIESPLVQFEQVEY